MTSKLDKHKKDVVSDESKREDKAVNITKNSIFYNEIYFERPADGATCEVEISKFVFVTGVDKNSVYADCSFNGTLTIADCDYMLDCLIDQCIRTMTLHEISSFKLQYMNETSGEDIECSFILKLITFTNIGYVSEWPSARKYHMALKNKEKGVEMYTKNEVKLAFIRFSKGLKLLLSIDKVETDLNAEDLVESEKLKVVLYNNLAMCNMSETFRGDKEESCNYVVYCCDKVLESEPGNVKGLWRRAVAKKNLGYYDAALSDFKDVLKCESTNKQAIENIKELQTIIQHRDRESNEIVKKMFQ